MIGHNGAPLTETQIQELLLGRCLAGAHRVIDAVLARNIGNDAVRVLASGYKLMMAGDGRTWPHRGLIASDVGMHPKSVQNCISELIRAEYLKPDPRTLILDPGATRRRRNLDFDGVDFVAIKQNMARHAILAAEHMRDVSPMEVLNDVAARPGLHSSAQGNEQTLNSPSQGKQGNTHSLAEGKECVNSPDQGNEVRAGSLGWGSEETEKKSATYIDNKLPSVVAGDMIDDVDPNAQYLVGRNNTYVWWKFPGDRRQRKLPERTIQSIRPRQAETAEFLEWLECEIDGFLAGQAEPQNAGVIAWITKRGGKGFWDWKASRSSSQDNKVKSDNPFKGII